MVKSILVPLYIFVLSLKGKQTGIYFVDSLIMRVCHIKREKQHKTFKGVASKSKSSMGWFFGFKLHLIINHEGEIVSFDLTPANINDHST